MPPGTNSPVSVSVVVPCRNERGHIERFLESLDRQDTSGIEWEAIIADGGSTDGTRHVLEEYSKKQSRIRVTDNPGGIVSTGLNAAIQAARGDVIIRMDVHTEYAPDYIRQCTAVLAETGAQNVGGAARTKAQGLKQEAISAAYHSPFAVGGARFHDVDYEGYVDTVPYGCWHKTTLQQIGLFDEQLVRNQDDELNLRLIRCGGKIWQSRRIVSWYWPRGGLVSLFRQYFQYGFWKVAVIRKHRAVASWRHLVPAGFVLTNLLLLVLSLLGISFAARALAASMALYASACCLFSLLACRQRGWRLLPLLPLVFATYHVSYGLGFLLGLLYVSRKRSGPARLRTLTTEITR